MAMAARGIVFLQCEYVHSGSGAEPHPETECRLAERRPQPGWSRRYEARRVCSDDFVEQEEVREQDPQVDRRVEVVDQLGGDDLLCGDESNGRGGAALVI